VPTILPEGAWLNEVGGWFGQLERRALYRAFSQVWANSKRRFVALSRLIVRSWQSRFAGTRVQNRLWLPWREQNWVLLIIN